MESPGNIFRKELVLLAIFSLAASLPVFADQEDTWNLTAGASVTNDSNLFRSGANDETSDQIKAMSAGVRVNKAISLQRFVVDASVTDFQYRDNGYLDYLGKNASAAWLWSITPQMHGNLSSTYSEVLNNFADYSTAIPSLRRNLRTIDTQRFDMEWEALGRLHLIGGVNRTKQDNSQPFLAEGAYTAKAVEYGIKYVLPTGSYVTVLARNNDGEYKNRVINFLAQYDSGFSQKDLEMKFAWIATEKSHLIGRVARIDREHDNFSSRDYDGTVGSLDYSLELTSKIRLVAGVKKDLVSSQTSYSSYYQTESYSITPSWMISPKTSLQARYNRETRDYLQKGNSAFKDTFRQESISLNWSPFRTMTFTATVQRDIRDSEIDARDFTAKIATLSANFVF